MAKNSVRDFSSTAASNTDIQSIDIDENCAASGINNAIREVMADLKDVSVGTVALESPEADSLTVTGDLTVDTNTLYVDSTNNRVGIVNASPSVELDVTGAAKVSGDLTVDTNTLYVDSTNNRVGIGTSSPSQKLVTKASSTNLEILNTVQNSNGGAGIAAIGFNVSDTSTEGDFTQAGIGFVRGVANGGGALAFYNKSDGATGNFTTANERMRIDSSGNVLFKVSALPSTGVGGAAFENDPNHGRSILQLGQTENTSTKRTVVEFYGGSNRVGIIQASNSVTSYTSLSDYRLKENVTATWDATTRLKQLNPVRFNFIADADTTVDGFLAHEVQTVVPEAITGTHNEVDDDGNPVYQWIDQSKLVPLLVATIQELEARIAALESN